MATLLLNIQNLSVSFLQDGGKMNAVKDISISVARGELLAIVGESGSGKSVTALTVLGLLPKQADVSGKILFYSNNDNQVDLLALQGRALQSFRGAQIGMIFQEPMTSLNPVYTCGNQVMEAIRLHQKVSKKSARQKTIDLFTKVKLPDPEKMLDRYPHQISGGQKQRVMIAIAISCNPALLIADEPTTALDVTVQKSILDLIKELQQENNMGVIFITHDLAVVADIADSIAVMYKGEIVEQGNCKDILKNPQHPYTQALLECRPSESSKGKKLPVVSDFLKENVEESGVIINPTELIAPSKNHVDKVILSVKNLTVQFPVKKNIFGWDRSFFTAVNAVSFTVQENDIVGLVGESGCGKTTLGRTILQLIKPTSGSIILDGKDITTMGTGEFRPLRKDLQIVFQDPYGSLNPRLTAGKAILEPLKVHGMYGDNRQRKEKVMELLEKVSMSTDSFNRYPHQFSGGQRQRICIARALALNPSFLIFDESVSALDVSVQAQVLNLLNDLKNEFGFTAIFISHDLTVVNYICNRIMVMHQGNIVESGTAEEVYYHPKNEHTQRLLNAIPGKTMNKAG